MSAGRIEPGLDFWKASETAEPIWRDSRIRNVEVRSIGPLEWVPEERERTV